MALVNGGCLLYTDMKKFLENLILWKCRSDFEIILQKCFLSDLSQKLLAKFYQPLNMALVNGDYFHYMDMNTFLNHLLLKPLVRFLNN